MRRLLAALALMAVLVSPAAAQQCAPVDVIVTFLQANPAVESIHVATATEVVKAVEIMNAMPPQTDDKFNTVILVTAKDGNGVALFGNDGIMCRENQMPMPGSQWQIFLRSVRTI